MTARLAHILPARELARALLPTYAEAVSVDDDEALDRLGRALEDPQLRDDLYAAIEAALVAERGPRTGADAQLDRLSKALAKHRNFKALASTPPVAAALVQFDLAAGLPSAEGGLSAVLKTDRGRALLAQGMAAIGQHLVKELLK